MDVFKAFFTGRRPQCFQWLMQLDDVVPATILKDMPQFPFPVYNPDMTDILPFSKPKASEKHRGNTLCRNGHHKWVVDKESVFDTKQGKLVTRLRCSRCSASKTRAI